jgi:hypothetical protein
VVDAVLDVPVAADPKQQRLDRGWPAEWSMVGTFTAAGAPAAILDPDLGRIAVVARGADGQMYWALESGQATDVWREWQQLAPGTPDPTATDPTVAPLTLGTYETWAIVFRNTGNATRVYIRERSSLPLRAKEELTFVGHRLPAPPN